MIKIKPFLIATLLLTGFALPATAQIGEARSNLSVGVNAVSYTHLDVYKRQFHYNQLGFFQFLNNIRSIGRLFVQQKHDAIFKHAFPHL